MKTTPKPSNMFPATPTAEAALVGEIRRDGPRMLAERQQAIREAEAQAELRRRGPLEPEENQGLRTRTTRRMAKRWPRQHHPTSRCGACRTS